MRTPGRDAWERGAGVDGEARFRRRRSPGSYHRIVPGPVPVPVPVAVAVAVAQPALTNASGVASTTIKLTQKNGKYALTATWTPTGADANHYVGSVASVTFRVQAK